MKTNFSKSSTFFQMSSTPTRFKDLFEICNRKDFDESGKNLQWQSFETPSWLEPVSRFNDEFEAWLDVVVTRVTSLVKTKTQITATDVTLQRVLSV